MEQHILSQIQQVFSSLQTPIILLDEKGYRMIPADDAVMTIPENLQTGKPASYVSFNYLRLNTQPSLILAASERFHQDILLLASAMIETMLSASTSGNDINSAYQRMLLNELSIAELDAVINEYHIAAEMNRCVLLMHMVQVQQRNAFDILSEVLPMSQGDVLVPMDRHTAAYIKNTSETEDFEEFSQYASAVQETLLSEIALSVTIGIGETAVNAADLHQSYRQARRAIEIGRVYKSESTIFTYRSLMLERFLSDLPADTASHYHGLLFNRKNARLFNDEMLYTIEMFFRKDLNLSDAARQLYIHRNTLVYRLDKVQRQIGLDLRKFNDAVTFKMLLEMKKCSGNKAKRTV